MKGGFNNPPNGYELSGTDMAQRSSMKGGFNNPPNLAAGDETARRYQTLQ